MTDYIHDEWCEMRLGGSSGCNCYVGVIRGLEALTATQNEYIALLGADIDRFMYLRISRGLNSPPEVAAKGQELRDRIATLAAEEET